MSVLYKTLLANTSLILLFWVNACQPQRKESSHLDPMNLDKTLTNTANSSKPSVQAENFEAPSLYIEITSDISKNTKANVLTSLQTNAGRFVPDFIKIKACPVNLVDTDKLTEEKNSFYCKTGIKLNFDSCPTCPGIQSSTLLPGLKEGSWTITAEACVYPERSLSEQLCGEENRSYYIQTQHINEFPMLQRKEIEVTGEFYNYAEDLYKQLRIYQSSESLCEDRSYDKFKIIPKSFEENFINLSPFERAMSLADSAMYQVSLNGDIVDIIDGIALNSEVIKDLPAVIRQTQVNKDEGKDFPSNDSDGDTIPNDVDSDDNNDGISDTCEASAQNSNDNDFDDDGILNHNDDSDNDGITDNQDAFINNSSESRDTDGDCIGDNEEKANYETEVGESSILGTILLGVGVSGISLISVGLEQVTRATKALNTLDNVEKKIIAQAEELFEKVEKYGKKRSTYSKKTSGLNITKEKMAEIIELGATKKEADFKKILKSKYNIEVKDAGYLWTEVDKSIKKIAETNFKGSGVNELSKLNNLLQGKSVTQTKSNLLIKMSNKIADGVNTKAKGSVKTKYSMKLGIGITAVAIGAAIGIGFAASEGGGQEFVESLNEAVDLSDDFLALTGSECTNLASSLAETMKIMEKVTLQRELRNSLKRQISGYTLEYEAKEKRQRNQ